MGYIGTALPAAFVLENVPRLRTLHQGRAFEHVMARLREVGHGCYELHVAELDYQLADLLSQDIVNCPDQEILLGHVST